MFESLKKMFGMEPIVMLDVDGVLNPLGDPNTRNPHTRVEGEYGVWFLNKDDGEWLKIFPRSQELPFSGRPHGKKKLSNTSTLSTELKMLTSSATPSSQRTQMDSLTNCLR